MAKKSSAKANGRQSSKRSMNAEVGAHKAESNNRASAALAAKKKTSTECGKTKSSKSKSPRNNDR